MAPRLSRPEDAVRRYEAWVQRRRRNAEGPARNLDEGLEFFSHDHWTEARRVLYFERVHARATMLTSGLNPTIVATWRGRDDVEIAITMTRAVDVHGLDVLAHFAARCEVSDHVPLNVVAGEDVIHRPSRAGALEKTDIELPPNLDRRAGTERRTVGPRRERWLPRFAFYSHLWIGILFTVVLLVISITGILLNHKRGLGLMPEVENAPTETFTSSLSLGELGTRALNEVGDARTPEEGIDRMDVRPRDGLVKVRLRDPSSTEVTLNLVDGRVLHVGARGDVFLEKLHSGEIFGSRGVLLSDAGAVALTLLLITGYWLWLRPRWRR